jgi:plasmid replication initiation protein
MSITEKKLVVQHNNIVEAKYRLTISEQRLIKYLVALIEKDDEDFKTYRIAVADLAGILQIKRKDYYQSVKNTTKGLVTKLLVFKSSGLIIQTAWLASAVYHDGEGFVDLQFSPLLKSFLMQLKFEFTKYELGNVIHLKHTYSMRIYELLKQYEKIGNRTFDNQTLRNTLGILENEYTRFVDFRRRVLKVAQQELAEKTDISFEWEEEKKNQKCVAITFNITKQKRAQSNKEQEQEERFIFEQEPASEVITEPPLNELIERLVAMGVTRITAEEITAEYATDRIEQAITYTQDKQQEGAIKNSAAFVVTAIKKDFTDALAETKRKKALLKQEQKKIAEETKAAEDKAKQEANEKYQKAFESYQALVQTEQTAIKMEFIKTADATTAGLIRKAQNQGNDIFASPFIASSFKEFLIVKKGF